ncbi:uncharacterized protein BDR25DRAFT_164376, partial [Lindgomyces ingoldianus]
TPKFAIFLVILSSICIVAVTLVVFVSHNRIASTWLPSAQAIQPTVLFALCTGVFNASQAYILTAGVTVVWWRSALHGTTLRNLHYIWNKGEWKSVDGLVSALSASSQTRWVMAVTCIVAIASIADGPLLQRATKPVLADFTVKYAGNASLVSSIDDGWTGGVDHTAPGRVAASNDLDKALQDWYLNNTISTNSTCPGTCLGRIFGAGLAVNCSSTESYLDLNATENGNTTLFRINFTRTADALGSPMLDMQLQYVEQIDNPCNATFAVETCSIRTAIVGYDVVQQEDVINLDAAFFPEVVSLHPSANDAITAEDKISAGPLAGVEYMGYYYLQSNATWNRYPDNTSGLEYDYGILAKQFADNYAGYDCGYSWFNATDYVLRSMHEFMFRAAYSLT